MSAKIEALRVMIDRLGALDRELDAFCDDMDFSVANGDGNLIAEFAKECVLIGMEGCTSFVVSHDVAEELTRKLHAVYGPAPPLETFGRPEQPKLTGLEIDAAIDQASSEIQKLTAKTFTASAKTFVWDPRVILRRLVSRVLGLEEEGGDDNA